MRTASILEAKTHFSMLVKLAEQGERITVTRSGKPVAEIVPTSTGKRPFGLDEGKIRMAPDFDAPLPPEISRAFGAE
jgi:prevent-host-death family protein